MECPSEFALQLRKNNRLLSCVSVRVIRNFVAKKMFIGKPITFKRHIIIEVPKSSADEMISFHYVYFNSKTCECKAFNGPIICSCCEYEIYVTKDMSSKPSYQQYAAQNCWATCNLDEFCGHKLELLNMN